LFEAWVQGVGILILIGGFLAYFADEVSVGPRYLRWTLAIQVGAFAAILGLFLAMREPMIFGAPRHLLVAGGVGIGFVLMAAGVIFTLRYVRKDPDRWLMAIGISFFLAGILVRGLAYFNSSFAIRPPMDVPYAVTASAIGVVLLGYLFVRTHAAEVRADLNVLEDQVRERTAHLEQALEELAVANSKLVEQSTIDGLTGAYNRRYFDEALEREWSRAARNGLHLALALVDLDRFKEINDQYGHPRGDDCLLCVATVLQGRLRRPGDVVARYGGDEFAVILPNTSESGAREALEDIRSVVENLSNAPAPGLTCSIGVASCIPKRGHSPEALLHMADERLYAAKVAGRNRVCASAADAAEVA
jgi:diguanylate cyclase (GGDEF)-like protein